MSKKTAERLITASPLLWAAAAPAFIGILVYDLCTYDWVNMESSLKFFSPADTANAIQIPVCIAWMGAGVILGVIQKSQMKKYGLDPWLYLDYKRKAEWLWTKVAKKTKPA